jgi:biopolymer transport protein ExbD
MADMGEGGGGHKEKGGKKRAKKGSTRVDMTPLVDLAFLLLTFFVLTSTFSKPKIMSLVYPAKPKDEVKVEEQKINNAITFLLTENKIFYYKGEFYTQGNAKGNPATTLEESTFGPQGVRKLLADLNSSVLIGKKKLKAQLDNKEIKEADYLEGIKNLKRDDKALKVLIKTDDKAICKNFIDLVDELRINEIGVIAPVDIITEEYQLLNAKIK